MDVLEGFQVLNNKYDDLFKKSVLKGKLPWRSTERGFFGAASLFALYEFFCEVQLNNYSHFLDLGSGDGRVVLLASLFTKASGVEFDEGLAKQSEEIRDQLGFDASFHKKNFLHHDLSDHDFIFINPDKGFSDEFEEKICREMKGHLFVYNNIYSPNKLEKGKIYRFDQLPITRYNKAFK